MRLQAIRVCSARGACRVRRLDLPVFTGKIQVTHINCVWGLFTSKPQVISLAFADNFARPTVTV